jgi:tetratricopeptide (TPR) repeat protein
MAQCMLITTLIPARCKLMWNFVREIPEWLARRVSAWIGREAHADTMAQGSALSRSTHQSDRSARSLHPLFVCLLGVGTLNPVVVVFAAERCPATNATRVVSVQGKVTWNVINNTTLTPAKLNDILCVGDTVRVGAKSRAVLRLSNATTVPLDQNTIFRLKEDISDKEPTLIELLQGAIHVITRTPKPFKVNTPHVNALVEGTEFYVGVSNEESRVAVIEGKVNVSNEQGAVLLVDNEVAIAKKGQAPQKTLTIKPRDAVQWALYYPPLFDPRSRSGGQNLSASHDLYSQGKITEAIESLDAIPQAERTGDYYSYRAGLLLLVGRADEAEPDIETALRENGNNTDALSLKAVIAIVRNDKVKALELANQAVNIDDKSASARIALSYALQASFKIEEALKAARQATERDANNALAWARVAELELSIPNYDMSKEAAETAVKLNPNLARTQSVLGFANLTRIDIEAAKANFNKAIELDQADPLPRLGLGLATIRAGNLEQGREQIEIAASLDPENALIRSYLGKAYFEEKRDTEAGKQYELAKERDINDPTSYLYDGIRNQTENRPVDALRDFETSIAKNGHRRVFRSQFLIEQDHAVRGINRARTYSDLGFEQPALSDAAISLIDDPTSYSAHRFLSDIDALLPRREISRLSELLQAQLLQPVNISTLQPSKLVANLYPSAGSSPMQLSFNEFDLLFERDRPRLTLSGIVGNHGTAGDELTVSGVRNHYSYSFGQFHYETNGFRENNDLNHDIYNLYLQGEVSRALNLQAEYRHRTTVQGDLIYRFEPGNFSPLDRRRVEQDTARLGGKISFSPRSQLIFSASHVDGNTNAKSFFPDVIFNDLVSDRGHQAEIQVLTSNKYFNLVSGVGTYRLDSNFRTVQDFTLAQGISCPVDSECDATTSTKTKQDNAYVYASSAYWPKLAWLVGLSWNHFSDGALSVNRLNPKFGLIWQPNDQFRIRVGGYKSQKRALVVDQTIEPTTVAGFNQFHDDITGTTATSFGAAMDTRTGNVYFGLEFVQRNLVTPSLFPDEVYLRKSRENSIHTYANWIVSDHWIVRVGYIRDTFKREIKEFETGFVVSNDVVDRVPINVRYFGLNRIVGEVTANYVRQHVELGNTSALEDQFVLIDAALRYKLPKRMGQLGLEVRNIFDTRFKFEVDRFRTSEEKLPEFTPRRTFLLRANFAF